MVPILKVIKWIFYGVCFFAFIHSHAASISDEERFSFTTIGYLGVFSTTLDSVSREVLTDEVIGLIQEDDELDFIDRTIHLPKLDEIYWKNRALNGKDLKSDLGDEKISNFIYMSFEKSRKIYICRIMSYSLKKGEPTEIAQIFLAADVNKRIRNAAVHIIEEILNFFALESKPEDSFLLYTLNPVISDAMVLKGDKVLQKDSVGNIFKGNTLKTGGNSGVQCISGKKFKYLLFPNSAYTFLDSHIIQVDKGRLGAVNVGQKTALVTSFSLIQLKKAIVEVHSLNLETQLRVFVGEADMRPMMEKKQAEKIDSRTAAVTRGYTLSNNKMADSALIMGFKPYKPFITTGIIKQFKKAKMAIFDEMAYDVDYFRSGSEDPMEYFIAAGFGDLGIPLDALLLESEAWRPSSKVFKPAINETSCYLCNPNRIGPDKP